MLISQPPSRLINSLVNNYLCHTQISFFVSHTNIIFFCVTQIQPFCVKQIQIIRSKKSVTFETWPLRHLIRVMFRLKDKNTERKKAKRKRPIREFNIVMSRGSFAILRCFNSFFVFSHLPSRCAGVCGCRCLTFCLFVCLFGYLFVCLFVS